MEVSIRVLRAPCFSWKYPEWTAPSAIGTAGIGFGGQAGAEVTDFLVVLNTRAVRSFGCLLSIYSLSSLILGYCEL